jgi:hypothetical protein
MIGEFLPRSALGDADVAAMYRLFRAHFDNVSERRFRADLAQKHWIVRVRAGRILHGFSSLKFARVPHGSATLNVLYSGDTIVSPEARASTLLPRTWIGAVRQLRHDYDARELYWLLLVSGFRTYRLLPVFWKTFLPCSAQEAPADERARMDAAAQALLGTAYCAADGIVRFPEPQICRADARGIAASRMSDPHVAFFLASNPGYVRGDELVCWTRLAEDNLTAAGARVWRAAEKRADLLLAG